MKISGQNILEINKGKSLLRIRRGREQMQQHDQRTRLSRICDVEIGYQVGSMREFRCRDLFRFVSSIFIP